MKPGDAGGVVHLELHTRDLPGAGRFYSQLCGWRQQQVDTSAGSYLALELSDGMGGGIGGGIVQCPTTRAIWLPYVEVQDVRQATHRARLLGARLMLPPREGPTGWRSVVATPAAGELALWQPKR